ncbi:MAG: hypothetical protein IH897_05155, partial [Planctomycetes bacterium]|nr:hypothetical protein [Planctomycetota bacterium]
DEDKLLQPGCNSAFEGQRQHIEQLLRRFKPSRVACLGSGYLNDLPIESLFEVADETFFIDWLPNVSRLGLGRKIIQRSQVGARCVFCEFNCPERFCRAFSGPMRETARVCTAFSALEDSATECMNYEPDLVILVFCLNDVVEKFNLRRFGGLTRGLEPVPRTLLDSSGLYQLSRLTVVEWMTGTMASVRQRRRQYSVERLLSEPTAPEFKDAWRSTLVNLEAIHLFTREESVPLAIVCFPYAEQLSPYHSYEDTPQEKIRAFAASRRVAFLDLAPMYRAYCRRPDVLAATGRTWEGLALFPDRIHPTPEGHRMAAEAIHEMIGQLLWPENP